MNDFARTKRGAKFFDRDVPEMERKIESLTEEVKAARMETSKQTEAIKELTEAVYALVETLKWNRS